MNSLIEPNIHPILVHFAYALMTTGALCTLITALAPAASWRETLKHAADWMTAFGALAVLAAVAAGFQAYYTVAHDGPSHEVMTTHRNWAVPTAGILLLLSLWRFRQRSKAPSLIFSVIFLAAAASLSVTAWWGGRVVYGHGIGVASLPQESGEGHNHDHADGHEHAPDEGHSDEAEENREHTGSHDEHDEETSDVMQSDEAETGEAPSFDHSSYPETPEAVVDAYAAALRAGDEAAVRAMLAPDVIIAEAGGAERSVGEYAEHHMPADMAFTAAVEFSLKKRDVLQNADMATVISESQVHGTFREQTVHSRMMETMVLKMIDGRWRIAHIHWSSAPITGEHEH